MRSFINLYTGGACFYIHSYVQFNWKTLGTSYEQETNMLEIVAVMSGETYMCYFSIK